MYFREQGHPVFHCPDDRAPHSFEGLDPPVNVSISLTGPYTKSSGKIQINYVRKYTQLFIEEVRSETTF